MSNQLVTISNWKGLHVQANSFALVPDGALERADNLVITRDGILQKRRGFFDFVTFLTAPLTMTEYQGSLILANDTTKLSKISSVGVIADVGTGLSFSRPRYCEAGGKLFVTTLAGVKVLDSITSTVRDAGLPPALDLEITASGQSGPLEPDNKFGYRVLFGFDGENGERLLSAPSPFTVVSNALNTGITASNTGAAVTITHTAHGLTGNPVLVVSAAKTTVGADITNVAGTYTGTVTGLNTITFTAVGTPSAAIATLSYGVYKQGNLVFTIPADLTDANFYQIYRTDKSGGIAVEPDEDLLKLIAETKIGTTDLFYGYVSMTDSVDPLFAGAYCYTNANTGVGAQNANYPPPLCADLALFKSTLFFASTTLKHSLPLLLVSAALILINDTITVGGQTYTAKAVENVASRQFLKVSSGSVAIDHDTMARSLCKCINRDTVSTVVAYYVTKPDSIPGQIQIEAKEYSVAFTFQCSRALAWNPDAISALDSSVASDANYLRFSKFEQFEHVPAWAYIPVGAKGEAILRIVALRDSLIVVKANSIWRVNGDAGNFVATLLDNTLSCRAPDSVVSLNNAVWMVTNQGITAVTDTGAQVVSRQIEPLLTTVSGVQAFYDKTNAVAYESDRAYVLATISNQDEVATDIVYYYNTVTQAFTSWTNAFEFGIVAKGDDKMYLIDGTNLKKERKNLNKVDYTDASYTVTVGVVAAGGMSATISTVGAQIAVGDIIVYSNTINRIIAADYSTVIPTFYFRNAVTFDDGDTAFHYVAIQSRFKTAPISLGNNGVLKQFNELSMHVRNDSLTACTIRFGTDSVEASADLAFETPSAAIGWGISYWGQRQWGDPNGIEINLKTSVSAPFRTYIPQDCQRATFLQIEMEHFSAGEGIDLQMLTLQVRPISTKV